MNSLRKTRFAAGYVLGTAIFLVLMPFGLYKISELDQYFCGFVLIKHIFFRFLVAGLFFFTGSLFMLWSNIYLFIRGRGGPAEGFGLEVSPRTSKLVASGPYRYTRNPMVFGAFCLYISITLMLNSPSGLLGLCILLLLVFLYLKISEEKRLSRDFGEEWIKYKKKTPMIFPCKFQRAGT